MELVLKRGQRRWSAGSVQRLCRPGSRGKRTNNFHRILTSFCEGVRHTFLFWTTISRLSCLVCSGPRRRIKLKTRWTGVGDVVLDQHWLRKPGVNILKLELRSQSEGVLVAVRESISTHSFQLWVNPKILLPAHRRVPSAANENGVSSWPSPSPLRPILFPLVVAKIT